MEQLRRQVEDLRKQNEELRKFSSSCATSPPLPGGRGGQSPDSAPPSTASPRSGALSPDSARCCPAGLPEARLPHPPTELERMLLRRRERILDKVSKADPELVAAQAALETAAQ
ncbi:unnamed protein product [Prorocentrum cordatum]|uniref:Protein CASP n=1 Tax=Prorocentrum cordatum TaxID=2364126 RepID=A0ABN9U2V5_9DINO|nr:unnamed protein product [Polarella glacialis]